MSKLFLTETKTKQFGLSYPNYQKRVDNFYDRAISVIETISKTRSYTPAGLIYPVQ